MKKAIFLLALQHSLASHANTLQVTCDSNQVLQSVRSATTDFKLGPETKEQEIARKKQENQQLEAKSDTAMQCLNQLKLSHQDEKTVKEINSILKTFSAKKKEFIQDQNELDRQMKKLDAQIQSCEVPELVQPKPRIVIESSVLGLNKNKNGSYEPEAFERVIETSLREGVDPFLTLSILLLENPPVVGSAKSDSYRQSFGTLPVDSIAAYDMMGCYQEKPQKPQIKDPAELKRLAGLGHNALIEAVKKYEKPETAAAEVECEQYKKTKSRCSAFLTGQKSVPVFDVTSTRDSSSKAQQYRLCSSDFSAAVGKFANFQKADAAGGPNNCCADIKTQAEHSTAQEDFLGLLGVKYVKAKIQECAKTSALTYCVQRYNGLGCFNCAKNQEQMKSDCLQGLIMSDRPVYGARAMDLMINSLITNNQIQNLVLKIARRSKANVVSILCFNKPGLQKIDSDQFENEQKEYLLNGQHHAYKFSQFSDRGMQFRTNQNDPHYQSAEARRKKSCAKYF